MRRIAWAIAAIFAGCTPQETPRETKPVESVEAAEPKDPSPPPSTAARIETNAPSMTAKPSRYKLPKLDPCALVTSAEVKAAVGFIGERQHATTSDDPDACTWSEPGKSAIIVKTSTLQEFDEAKHVVGTAKKPLALKDIGDAAFYTALSSKSLQGGSVIVRKGEAAASVQVLLMGSRMDAANAKKRSIALAKIVATKL